ncbi:MAG: hypothetical protein IJX01_04365 [Oscillospiraceae bacterium]|nr:hypothetical protein [Oscillospiraceae bacterium]
METNIALQNARAFIKMVKTGKLPKEILPNSSPNYTYDREKKDTAHYVQTFLNSSSYDFIKRSEEVRYNGE